MCDKLQVLAGCGFKFDEYRRNPCYVITIRCILRIVVSLIVEAQIHMDLSYEFHIRNKYGNTIKMNPGKSHPIFDKHGRREETII